MVFQGLMRFDSSTWHARFSFPNKHTDSRNMAISTFSFEPSSRAHFGHLSMRLGSCGPKDPPFGVCWGAVELENENYFWSVFVLNVARFKVQLQNGNWRLIFPGWFWGFGVLRFSRLLNAFDGFCGCQRFLMVLEGLKGFGFSKVYKGFSGFLSVFQGLSLFTSVFKGLNGFLNRFSRVFEVSRVLMVLREIRGLGFQVVQGFQVVCGIQGIYGV